MTLAEEYRLRLGGREWSIRHGRAVFSLLDEQRYLSEEQKDRAPYGTVLWPSAVALAHEVVARGDAWKGRSVLELGAGTGLPGIIAASLGARVVQTDKQPLALDACRENAARNGVAGITVRQADWATWDDPASYDVVIGSDVIYSEAAHPLLRDVLARAVAPNGRALLADPFRKPSLGLLEMLEQDGWTIALTKWSVGEGRSARPIGVYELTPSSREHAG